MTTPLTPSPADCLPYPLKRAKHVFPALCPGHVTLKPIPLGQPPSLHHLLGLRLGLVRRLCRYYGAVRLPVPVHHRRVSLDFPLRPPSSGGHRISRFPLKVLTYMHRVLDRARSRSVSRYRRPRFCLPTISTAWAPRSKHRSRDGVSISRLNTWPARPPVNASPAPLRTPMHDSELVRVASPSPYETSFTTPCRFLPAHRNSKQFQMAKIRKFQTSPFYGRLHAFDLFQDMLGAINFPSNPKITNYSRTGWALEMEIEVNTQPCSAGRWESTLLISPVVIGCQVRFAVASSSSKPSSPQRHA
jgi:hypothetical protein